ncbi:MAG: metallophosphoesterase [Oscillospiraceae bacterium]|nr:metallophosphoesterase [Oscillospiraceae bacterium]
MAIFAIGDLHLSLGNSKPMDIFPGWKNHVARIEENWRRMIGPEDTVVLAGDTSWAMRLEDTEQDFAFIQSLPGRKLLVKGNHDYWWSTANKMYKYFEAKGFDSLQLLHNNSYEVEGVALCGTRSWLFDIGEAHDEKVMNRELGRLRMSLESAGESEKIVFLHYPPVYPGTKAPEVIALLKEFGVTRCFYGHLHGSFVRHAVQGRVDGIEYRLISADGLNFCPLKIEKPLEITGCL